MGYGDANNRHVGGGVEEWDGREGREERGREGGYWFHFRCFSFIKMNRRDALLVLACSFFFRQSGFDDMKRWNQIILIVVGGSINGQLWEMNSCFMYLNKFRCCNAR